MFEVEAPAVTRKAKPGQFVILMNHVRGERIPTIVAGADPYMETVTLVFAEVACARAVDPCALLPHVRSKQARKIMNFE